MTRWLGKALLLFALCLISDVTNGLGWPFESKVKRDDWKGKWFPQPPNKALDDNPTVDLADVKHGIKMGIPNPSCDDGKTNLTIDWDNSPVNYTCFEDKTAYFPNTNVHPLLFSDHIPKEYMAPHHCMNVSIFYSSTVPTFGAHRPLWPKYGEYIFVPKERWLHSLEHGAVVMLYHPCANANEVQLLRTLVTGCLFRHIISPYNLLEPKRPLALVTWGYRFEMSKVDPDLVTKFIRSTALRGPEQKADDGQFEFGLTSHAKIVSDKVDSALCPNI